jgi:hypothetical protein
MTTHVFEINELKKEAASMFSRLLPLSLGLERSTKRLNVRDELKDEIGANVMPYISFIE